MMKITSTPLTTATVRIALLLLIGVLFLRKGDVLGSLSLALTVTLGLYFIDRGGIFLRKGSAAYWTAYAGLILYFTVVSGLFIAWPLARIFDHLTVPIGISAGIIAITFGVLIARYAADGIFLAHKPKSVADDRLLVRTLLGATIIANILYILRQLEVL